MTTTKQYPLANDANGDPLDIPAHAVAWRVRRGGGRRGRPRVVFDAETGRQLEIGLGATIDDLIDHGCPPGRYRLEAIDADGRMIPGVIAITEIPAGADEPDEEAPEVADPFRQVLQLVGQLVDTNCRAMEAMASAFGQVRPAQIMYPPEPPHSEGMKPDQLAQLMELAKGVASAFTQGATGGGNAS